MSLVIDAHHHFWHPDKGDYPWLAGAEVSKICRPFTPDDLRPLLAEAGVDKTIVVQTWSSLQETWDFLDIAGATDFVAGVVGWVDLTDPGLAATLTELKTSRYGRYLVAVRHQVHDEPDPEWLLRDDVQRGLTAVQQAGLAYDLLTRPRELPAALTTVARFPNLRFVIDHISKPEIGTGEIEHWQSLMQSFAEQRHVYCKLSGMVTEADWDNWVAADLKPYVDTVIEVFGSDRLLFGSDWPVSLLAASYVQVKQALLANIAHLDATAQAKIMGGNALQIYRLPI